MTSLKRKLRQRIMPGALILLYHRVIDLRADPQLLTVKPSTFRTHLEIIRKKTQPVSMQRVSRAMAERRPLRRAVAVTFDDGYGDNLEIAKPLLQRYEVPATVHVSTGYAGGNSEFWWDELERLLLLPGDLPSELDIQVEGRHLRFDLGEAARFTDADAARYTAWNVQQPDCPTPRHQAYVKIGAELRNLGVRDRDEVLNGLRAQCGVTAAGRRSHLPMDRPGIVELASGGLVDVAAHTVNHPRLSCLSRTEQEYETLTGKKDLEGILGTDVPGFAYPFGASDDYDAQSVEIARQCGFEWALANTPGTAWHGSDRFQLPRVLVRDWDAAAFERLIDRWL